MTAPTVRVFDLYPWAGGFTNQQAANSGTTVRVLAVSIKQAYALAYKRVPSKLTTPRPIGVLETYHRSPSGLFSIACGCQIHWGLGLQHGDGITRVRAAVARHLEDCPYLGGPQAAAS